MSQDKKDKLIGLRVSQRLFKQIKKKANESGESVLDYSRRVLDAETINFESYLFDNWEVELNNFIEKVKKTENGSPDSRADKIKAKGDEITKIINGNDENLVKADKIKEKGAELMELVPGAETFLNAVQGNTRIEKVFNVFNHIENNIKLKIEKVNEIKRIFQSSENELKMLVEQKEKFIKILDARIGKDAIEILCETTGKNQNKTAGREQGKVEEQIRQL